MTDEAQYIGEWRKLKQESRCKQCLQWLVNREGIFVKGVGTFHLDCFGKFFTRKKWEKSRMEELETGGKAGAYHARGGRVIRGTNSC